MTILSVDYYDEYPVGSPAQPSQIQNQTTLGPAPTTIISNGLNSVRSTKTLPTASYTKNVENDRWSSAFIWYDTLGRIIGTDSRNHLGGYTKTESELDFTGLPQKDYVYHARKADESGVVITQRYVYDSQKRLKQHYHQVDDKPEVLLKENTYNELSQLVNKKVGNNLQSIDYTYNIRGWLTDINKNQMALADLGGKLFSYKIKYNQKDGIDNPDQAQFGGKNVTPKYNGNIAEIDWRAIETVGVNPSLTPKRYGYSYDSTNRLLAGYYQNPNNPYSKENTESLEYDLNGNISNLYRTSVIEGGSNTATVIDNLAYAYLGNQATSITDASQNFAGYEGGGGSISYDGNGNMIAMPDKGISSITYNYLDLPSGIEVNRNGSEYVSVKTQYSADGTKLKKESTTTIVGVAGYTTSKKTTDYLDGFQYLTTENPNTGGGDPEMLMASSLSRRAMEPQAFSIDERRAPSTTKTPDLQYFATAEGFYDYVKDQYIYQYIDQLGNVRVSYGRNSEGVLEITDNNDYYPFGMNHLKSGTAFFAQGSYKSNKYNGKELQETGLYDYGWRQYMPDIGRWNGMDQLAESYLSTSPYAYVMNSPVNMFDPDGRESMLALTEAMWNATPDGTNSYWTNSGSDGGGKPGGSGGGGFFVYTGGTAGLSGGYGIGSTLDFAGNFNSQYGSVTNGVLNYTYWTNGTPASGNSIQGLAGHSMSLNLNSANGSSSTNYLDYANFANDRIGDVGSILEHTRNQGGSIAFWRSTATGSTRINLRYYRNNWGGNGYTGSTRSVAKYLGKGALVTQIALGAIEVGNGIADDVNDYNTKGVTNGRNTVVTAAKVTSGILAGMYAGAAIGTAIPIPIVGTIVGAVGGAIVGYFIGEAVGRDVNEIYDNFEK
jgi:RHS repeat-associated protein